MQKPSLGRIVLYTLTDQDAEAINKRRADGQRFMPEHRELSNGTMVHVGNSVSAGDVFPMVITRVWGHEPGTAVNGQLLLDGNDLFWVTSATEGDGPRSWAWPQRG